MRRQSLALAVVLSLHAPLICADEPATPLETVVVVAARGDQPIVEVAGSVGLISREQIETRLIRDLRDLARYDASLSVPEESSRFGAQGFALRGLDGNRVAIELDGVPFGDGFSVGSFSRASRNLIDPDLLERVEYLRGPASSLYGSDALAGVVALRSRDPIDLLAERNEPALAGLRLSFDGRDSSHAVSTSTAAVAGNWQMLVQASERRDQERDNQPRPGGLDSNPAAGRERFAFAKLIRDTEVGQFVATVDGFRAETRTDVRSLVHGPGQYLTTSSLSADDSEQRQRASLAFQQTLESRWIQQFDVLAFVQRSDVLQRTQQDREATAVAAPTRRLRDFDFATHQSGLEAKWQGQSDRFALSHDYVFGFDLARTALSESRDGLEINQRTGVAVPVILGERMPVRDFPNSTVQELGIYAQDEIGLGTHWFLIPSLRFDRYRLDADPDELWIADNPGTAVVDRSTESLTPRLGIRFRPNEAISIYAQYAAGFRAPPFSDVNLGLNIPAFGYSAIPNPDLRPERSRGLELGAHASSAAGYLSLSLYHNRYRDLIESRINLGRDAASGLLVFQSQNRERARIQGVELQGEWDLASIRLPSFALIGSASWTEGEDTRRGLTLNSVDPARLVLGLSYGYDADRQRLELLGRFAQGKRDLDLSRGALFATPGHGVLDLFWHYRPNPSLQIDAGISNLADRRYWQWSAVRGLAADAREIDLATESGRALMVTLRLGAGFGTGP